MLRKLLEKAQTQLNAARKTEAHAAHNLAFKPSLEDQSENDEEALEQPETQKYELSALFALEKSEITKDLEVFEVAQGIQCCQRTSCKRPRGQRCCFREGYQRRNGSMCTRSAAIRSENVDLAQVAEEEQAASQAETNGNISKQAAGSKNRTAQRDAVVAEEQQKLAEKALENQAEVEAIHVEEDVTCGTAASNRHCAERHG